MQQQQKLLIIINQQKCKYENFECKIKNFERKYEGYKGDIYDEAHESTYDQTNAPFGSQVL